MLFQLNVNLNEDDYFAFNLFHTFESTHGKKMIKKSRNFFILVMFILAVLFLLMEEWTVISVVYMILLLLVLFLWIVFFKMLLRLNIRYQIKQLKKLGKLPFDPISTLEFYEDRIVEITASSRTEQNYTALERIYIAKDQYIFLYKTSVSAYMLPIAQVNAQLNQESFIDFLTKKCTNVEYY